MKEKISGIYCIKNIITNIVYIGSSVNIFKRTNEHKYDLNKNRHHNRYLQRAWNKYGEENFEFSTIEIIDDINKLIEREQFWMDKLEVTNKNKGYNLTSKAGTNFSMRHTEETKRKISEGGKGRKHSEYTKFLIGQGNKGKIISEKQRQRLSQVNTGKKVSEESRQKMRDSSLHKGNYQCWLEKYGKEIADNKLKEQSRKGSISRSGKIASLETRKRMSEAGKGRVFTEEHKAKIGKANKNRKLTQEQKQKISLANKGRIRSAEIRKKMSESKKNIKGRPHSEETKQKISKARKLYLSNKISDLQ